MSKSGRINPRRTGRAGGRQQQRRLSIRAIRREQPDVRRLGRAFIALAMAEAEREAETARNSRSNEPDQHDEPDDAAAESRS